MRFSFYIGFIFSYAGLAFCSPLHAQKHTTFFDWQNHQQVIVQEYDQSDGLPVISLTDVVFGADGYMYIASSAGVNRFNGTGFELISSEQFPEIRSNRFIQVHAAKDSAIWLIDEDFFFSRWKNGKVTTYPHLHESKTRPDWLFRMSKSGIPWITNGHSLRVFSDNEGFLPASYLFEDRIIDFLPISDQKVLVLTQKGLFSYTESELSGELTANEIPMDITRTEYWETNLIELSGGRIAMFNFDRLMVYHLNSKEKSIYTLPREMTTTPVSIIQAEHNQLLLHSFDGHYDLDLESGEVKEFQGTAEIEIDEISYNTNWQGNRLYIAKCTVNYGGWVIYECDNNARISEAVHDREGNLWLSIAGKGLTRISISPFKVLNKEQGLYGSNTYSIIEDANHAIWVASYEAGIHRIQNNRIDFWQGKTEGLNNILIRALYERDDGTLFTASWDGGISTYNGRRWNQYFVNDTLLLTQAESFLSDSSGNFWIGSRHGLYKQKAGSDSYEFIQTENDEPLQRVQVMQQANDGKIWFGTNGTGLFLKTDEIRHIEFNGLKSELSIRDIFIDSSQQILWLATENYGLVRAEFNANDQLLNYELLTEKDGLGAVGVHRILLDPFGYFWLSSNQGIFRIKKTVLDHYLNGENTDLWIQQFTEKEGLPNREANGGVQSSGILASDGSIWFPTQKGLINFNPDYFLDKNPFEHTQIQLNSVITQDSTYTLYSDHSLSLNKGDRTATLNFDLIHFTNPDAIHLEYRIPGLSNRWQPLANTRELNITNISPGTYIIETRIAGVPEALHAGSVFRLTIPFYFYERSWFFAFIAFAVMGLFSLVVWSIRRTARQRERVLNHKVKVRTASLKEQKNATEKALKKIQKQAVELKQLNEVKTNFFINITHELRTPLALIKGPLELLKEASHRRNIKPEVQLALIERNSDHLMELIDRLLNLMKMETDQLEKDVKVINLGEFIRPRFEQFKSSDQLKDKKYELRVTESNAIIAADPHSLESIINNLISNAIKYTNANDCITVSVGAKDSYFYFEVEDTGIGIDEDELSLIFDPFYRSKNTDFISGSGIGLSIVKRLMDRIGGKIESSSTPGAGTAIRLLFPAHENLPSESDSLPVSETSLFQKNLKEKTTYSGTPHVESPSHKNDENREKSTLLIVEDNDDLRQFMCLLLEEQYQVLTADGGRKALEKLGTQPIDLIISDVMMPDMNGIELASRVREIGPYATIPIILLSAKKTEKSITEGLAAGAQVYLTKPVQNRILFAQIESLLKREREIKKNRQDSTTHSENEFVRQIHETILRHLSDPNLTVDSIAEVMHMSRSTLYRRWKKNSKLSLNEYIITVRLEETIQLITKNDYTFAEVAIICGFSDASYFSQVFKKYKKMTPSQYFEEVDPG